MNNNSTVASIKRSQKESLLLRELSKMLHQLSLDDKALEGLIINKVELSKNKGFCYVYFYDSAGPETFRQKLNSIVLYKPTMRKALASIIDSRYVPDLKFLFDESFEKKQRIETLIDEVKKEFNE